MTVAHTRLRTWWDKRPHWFHVLAAAVLMPVAVAAFIAYVGVAGMAAFALLRIFFTTTGLIPS